MKGSIAGKVILAFVVSMSLLSSGMIVFHMNAMRGPDPAASLGAIDIAGGKAPNAQSSPRPDRAIVAMLVWTGALLSLGVVVVRHLLSGAGASLVQAREELETDSRQTIRELEAMNKELTDFAHIVSHDLKAPLRGIGSIIQWMEQDWQSKLSDEDKEQINHLTRRVARMQNLIDGVLQYSKAGSGGHAHDPVDPNVLVPQVIDTIAPPKGVEVRIAPDLPIVQFSEVQFMQVCQNLLSNAVKHMDKPQGVVEFQCRDTTDYWEFAVSDNGPGIPKQYHSKIFEVFQVLTARDEKESTGVGLAIVKKIIESGGGQVWVESEEGKGSTFLFTLPKRSDSQLAGTGDTHEKHEICVAGRG